MRQEQHHISGDAVRVAMRQLGIAIIQQLHRPQPFPLLRQIRRAVRRQHLFLGAGLVHQFEPAADVDRRARDRVVLTGTPTRGPNRSPMKSLNSCGM